jgi:flavorubredoxin
MTIEDRLTRLEGIVEKLATNTTAFIQSATEFNATVTSGIDTLSQVVQSQGAIIRRLDEMITRFDEWLREQGPRDGHEKRD